MIPCKRPARGHMPGGFDLHYVAKRSHVEAREQRRQTALGAASQECLYRSAYTSCNNDVRTVAIAFMARNTDTKAAYTRVHRITGQEKTLVTCAESILAT